MNDVLPDNQNRLAAIVSRIFHPAVMGIPTLFVILSELSISDIFRWMSLILGILLVPNIILQLFLQRQGRFVYQRGTRLPLYVVGWLSVLVCLFVLVVIEAPRVLLACLLALLVWVPIQLLINQVFTKISIHTAVVAGCLAGLLVLGKLDSSLLKLLALSILIATAWARMVTKNHTLLQVALGATVGCLPVLLVFPLMLP